ncbi:ParA family protein [Paracidovorax citrulli]|uniref:ATPase involved in chromosome partitioning-like protein n=2 Tax=Paracidovorax citrulli TaxID=80869 RepID=A1TPR4_PARC0|nr:ParA family protein [Paracidovorax citrulli]ABM32952.1 ATPase involved in chromosome partitioning-like protein [Paracidovorax citrulli AAC00-1]ATG93081.1 ParA family protein [Paracidovorax citrulli]RLJ93220.1 cellulose biosynthesis protein BcsQ [Paracidovorax citrulli]WIY40491.1 ParA family protein [Paracidovorax citrulli]WIY42273.1 ParA family protein [Paracidovorax citrulli]
MGSGLSRIIANHDQSIEEGYEAVVKFGRRSYAVSNLRGGIGKSTLSFNLAWLFTRHYATLVADLCPQKNLTESLMRGQKAEITIGDALRPKVLGPAFGEVPEDISYRISNFNDHFKGAKSGYFVPGDGQLFSFPSALYQQLQQAMASSNEKAVRNILLSLKGVLNDEAESKSCSKILMDCSPFYGGGTHLAWCAADALIIPVRVDEHSIESLDITLDMLSNPASDFNVWGARAGGMETPKVAAIVMTMVGARSPKKGVKDRASQMYVERAYGTAAKYPHLFDVEDPADAFVITDDFMSAGRISGAEGIPIPKLKVGQFHTVNGSRLQVNQSQTKYRKELEYLAAVL